MSAETAVIPAKTFAGIRPSPAETYAATRVPGKKRLIARPSRPSLPVRLLAGRSIPPNHFLNQGLCTSDGPTARASAYTPRSPIHKPTNALTKASLESRALEIVRVAAV